MLLLCNSVNEPAWLGGLSNVLFSKALQKFSDIKIRKIHDDVHSSMMVKWKVITVFV